ncbi:GntR family transcriptional regulator [Hoeflea sp. BAL378]|uniref:GntR family transcriptional regulator n=1 Tax=Hoeflea sp. BAL378 TaxID=1547437 RepID=UPI0005145AD7|nr:GntR family transcriptional regulator [Hoeflea sp. BAL378]KGF67633.1 GntR family transcriptional regulator [Hoeflea sp. BAL378]
MKKSRPSLTPLDDYTGSLSHKVYLSLKQAILTLEFRPGEMMQKSHICTELGVSRSPVTEAMARLASEGLVDIVPQTGTFVTRFSMAEIREGAFLREALELAAVERVASTITEEQLVALRRNLRIQEALMQDGDTAGFYQVDAQMHELILSFTGYRRLAALAETSWIQVNRARRLNLPLPGRMKATLAEHKAIVAALEAHDPQAARAATRRHLNQLITLLEPLVARHPELFSAGPAPSDVAAGRADM